MVNRKRNEFAFSLLELLVAMALMNILAVSLYASLYIGFKARKSAQAASQPVRAAQITMELIKQDIAAALPPTGILAGQFLGLDERTGSGADCDSLLFYSSNHTPELQETACDIREIELIFVPSSVPDQSVLVRRITTNLLSPKTVQPVEEILCRRVVSFNLGYFDGFDWWDEWDSVVHNNALPKAVEISLEIERDDENKNREYSGYRLSYAFIIPCSNSSAGDEVTAQAAGLPNEGR